MILDILIKMGPLTTISVYLEGPNIKSGFQRPILRFDSYEFELFKTCKIDPVVAILHILIKISPLMAIL